MILWSQIRIKKDLLMWNKKKNLWSAFKKKWSCHLRYEKKLILWSEIQKWYHLMIWDTKKIWSYDLRHENNLNRDHFPRDLVILISPDLVIAWVWSWFFCDPRFFGSYFFLWSRNFDLEKFTILHFLDHKFWSPNCEELHTSNI